MNYIKPITDEICIINNYSYLTIFVPFIINDDYEGDIECYACYNLSLFDSESNEFCGQALLDLPSNLTLRQLKNFCTIYKEYIIYSIIEYNYLYNYIGTSLSELYKDFSISSSYFNYLFKSIVLDYELDYVVNKDYKSYIEELKEINISLFPNKLSKTLKNKILKRDGYKCVKCGNTNNLQVHHIKPRSKFGVNLENNLITLCDNCHNFEHKVDNHQDIVPYLKKNELVKYVLTHLKLKELFPHLTYLSIPAKYKKSPVSLDDLVKTI